MEFMKKEDSKRPIDILMTISKIAAIILLIAMGLIFIFIRFGGEPKLTK